MPSLPLYGLGEIVSYAGFRWEITGFEPNEKEGCWIYDLKKVDGTDDTESGINELGLTKSYLMEKSADGMSDEERIKYYMQKLGIAGAGPVPNSLLAMQDLETSKFIKGTDQNSFAVWYYDKFGSQKCAVFGSIIDAEAYANLVTTMGFNDVKIMKGQVENTGQQLKEAAEDAEDAETSEKKTLVQNIKAIQVRRQKATLAARVKETTKSFKQAWSNLNKKTN